MSKETFKYPGLNKPINPPTKIEIKLSCSNLPKFDKLSQSDPKVFIFIEKKVISDVNVNSIWCLVDSTEVIKNNNNPVFTKTFSFDYYFEVVQNIRFMVVDMDSNLDEWEKNDFLGYVDVSLAEIISRNENGVIVRDLKTSVPPGIKINNSKAQKFSSTSKIFISMKNYIENKYNLKFNISGKNLDKKDTFGKSDPYFIIKKAEDNGSMVNFYQSSIIKNTLNPTWEPFEMTVNEFNKGDFTKPLLFEVWDWDKDTKDDLIGTFTATTNDLFNKKEFPIINEKIKNKKEDSYENSGTLVFNIEKIRTKEFSFMEFPYGGTEIAVSFAIDFTGSNGLPHLPDSLHYNKPDYDVNNFYTLNDYEKALSAIGYVLEPYDNNKYIEVYGYGGKFFGNKIVEFDRALTGDQNKPSVHGVAGVLEVYHKALQSVYLSGPTNFAPIIKKITEEAKNDLLPPNQNNPLHRYHILAIITDGMISDMDNTKEAIINAVDAPLSILIIGVGEKSKFDKMKELDGDDNVLKIKNKVATRDIVQFLPLNDFVENPDLLTAETLKEIPKQLIEFANKYKYTPKYT